jgi:hypothetical protein
LKLAIEGYHLNLDGLRQRGQLRVDPKVWGRFTPFDIHALMVVERWWILCNDANSWIVDQLVKDVPRLLRA